MPNNELAGYMSERASPGPAPDNRPGAVSIELGAADAAVEILTQRTLALCKMLEPLCVPEAAGTAGSEERLDKDVVSPVARRVSTVRKRVQHASDSLQYLIERLDL